MKIELGRGIDNINFGLKKQDVEALWGDADRSYSDESGDQFLAYFRQKTAFRFEQEQGFRLTWIECFNTDVELLGKKPFQMPADSLTYLIEQRAAEEPESFEMGWLDTLFYQEDWLELQFQFGELSALNFGLNYNEQDKPQWPTT